MEAESSGSEMEEDHFHFDLGRLYFALQYDHHRYAVKQTSKFVLFSSTVSFIVVLSGSSLRVFRCFQIYFGLVSMSHNRIAECLCEDKRHQTLFTELQTCTRRSNR